MRPDAIRGCASAIIYKDSIILGSWTDRSIVKCSLPKEVNPKLPKTLTIIEWVKNKLK